MMPKFSVIIPAYNAASSLKRTLDSIRAQTCPDWETIVVDDGSTDETVQIAEAMAREDARVRVVRNPKKGPSAARNFGAFDCASGTFLAFCDADDQWLPSKLATIAETYARAPADAVFGKVGFFRQSAADVRTVSSVPVGVVTAQMLLGENPVCTMSNLTVRRDVFLRLGGFDLTMVHNEDLEWLIRLVAEGHVLRGLDHLQVLYRTNTSGLSSDLMAMQEGRQQALITAARYGLYPDPAAEAVYFRYLARRALRLNANPALALRFTLQGLSRNARAYLFPLHRGLATAVASLVAPMMPAPLRRSLFSH